jgi:hypothetical protein
MTIDEVNAILDEAVAALPESPFVEPVTVNSRLLVEHRDGIRILMVRFELDAIYVFGSAAIGRDYHSDIDVLAMAAGGACYGLDRLAACRWEESWR